MLAHRELGSASAHGFSGDLKQKLSLDTVQAKGWGEFRWQNGKDCEGEQGDYNAGLVAPRQDRKDVGSKCAFCGEEDWWVLTVSAESTGLTCWASGRTQGSLGTVAIFDKQARARKQTKSFRPRFGPDDILPSTP